MPHLINIAVNGTKQRNLQATTTHLKPLNGGFQLATVETQLRLAFGMKDLEQRAGYVPERIVDFAFLSWSVDCITLCHLILWQAYKTLMTKWLHD